ncbi:MAG: ATP-binding cassette domain-containing protein [Candidatus Bipolaricaulota bacterium]|nr:ATP-binding cassette domain-containing protein [Candidatus Bipolaricaulota bacterium]MDW8329871.1 ATP-binding cassette domain-containing protein [Candidatus Bipolaricaulota bacterium]
MSFIEVCELSKHFFIAKHRRGVLGALRNLLSRERIVIKAVDRVSFTIERGELIGYIGPNGAGKSTTIKMLTGILVPTSGSLTVGGRVPWRERIEHTRKIGVVFGQRTNLWWDLPVIESFDLLRHIYKISHERYNQNLKIFEELLSLGEFLQTPVRSLSLGQRMRADLAAALLHDPEVLFLDEPTIGLDVVAKERIRSFIKEISAQRGVTVILTTHDLGDVERLCKRILLIDHGQLLFDGPLSELQNRFGNERELVVDFAEDYEDVSVDGATVISREGQRVAYRFPRGQLSASELIQRLASRYRIIDVTVREPAIEDTVRRIYEEKLLRQ